jgi:hypothetical protein
MLVTVDTTYFYFIYRNNKWAINNKQQ